MLPSRLRSIISRLPPLLPAGAACLAAVCAQVAIETSRGSFVPANRPIQAAASGYAGSASCKACHPAEYASWHASYHRTMTQVADARALLPEIDGRELRRGDSIYVLSREGSNCFVTKRVAGREDAPAERRQVVLLTGSHHQQNLWLESSGRTLEAFPFAWLVAEKRWAPVEDTFLAPPEIGEGRGVAWNNSCLNCHVTNGRPLLGTDGNYDSRVTEFGIACEACHGEGAAHVAVNQNPLRRYVTRAAAAPDPTIVNPARLSGPASALVCGQCHGVWEFSGPPAIEAWNARGSSYRPGQADLADRRVVNDGSGSFWPDGMVRVTGREYNGVQASPCFAGGDFSCLSCHEMHPAKTDPATIAGWTDDQLRVGVAENSSCLQCHQKLAADLPGHTHHAAQSSGSSCYNCHMPYTSYGLLGAVRSHQVSSPTAQESIAVGRPNACLLCHLDQPMAWAAERLGAWYGQPVPPLTADQRTISAAATWILKGDAGQRALVAWSMGWAPAQEASGRDWIPPYLAVTLNDPYAAVRSIAGKSLQSLPAFADFAFDYTAPDEETFRRAGAAYQAYLASGIARAARFRPAVMLDAGGRFQPEAYNRLLDQRDNRRIYLVE